MKRILLMVILLCIMPSVIGGYVDAEIEYVKVYVDNERVSSADEDGGTIDIEGGENLEFQIRLQNNRNETIEVKIEGEIKDIKDGEDIEKSFGWFDIGSNDDKSKILSFSIPEQDRGDEFDMDLIITFRYNDTEDERKIEYTIEVIERYEKVSVNDAIFNMSSTCSGLINQLGKSFYYINKTQTCESTLGDVKEERGMCFSDRDDCVSNLAVCNSEKETVTEEKTTCEKIKSTMLTSAQCTVLREADIKDVKGENNKTLFFMGAIGFAIWFFIKSKKGKTPEGSGEYYNTQFGEQ